MKILIATTNKGKKEEIAALFEGTAFELIYPNDLGIQVEVEETGSSYAENASLKAVTLAKIAGLVTLADDTGLEVEELNGAPGIYSARYADITNPTDADRRAKLLAELRSKPVPWKARFCCAVALAEPQGKVSLFDGEIQGEIIDHERGDHGFGYDRIFWIPERQKTMAELTMEEKNACSHRAMAVKKAIDFLNQ